MIPGIWLMRSALAYRLTGTLKGKTSLSNIDGPKVNMIVYPRWHLSSFTAASLCWLRRAANRPS
jgi:hypothetical protein